MDTDPATERNRDGGGSTLSSALGLSGMLIRRLPFWARDGVGAPNCVFNRLRQYCLIAVCLVPTPAATFDLPSRFPMDNNTTETMDMDVDHPDPSEYHFLRDECDKPAPASPLPAAAPASPPRPGHFPFPKIGQSNEIETQYIDITGKKVGVRELKNYCMAFGLSGAGKKEILKQRLISFSESPERWMRLKPRATRTQLGPREGKSSKRGKGSAIKQSARRAAANFPVRTTHALAHMPLPLPSAVPVQTESQRASILAWAKTTVERYPYLDKAERHAAAAARLESRTQSNVPTNDHELQSRIASVETTLSSLQMSAPGITPASAHVPLICAPMAVPGPQISTSMQGISGNASATSEARTLESSSTQAAGSLLRTLHLAGGVTVTFSASDVGPPPATTFASDIDLLNRMWDDTSKHWCNYSHLMIKDKYIPIVYWKQVYSRWPNLGNRSGSHPWRSIKNQYSQWKALVSRYRQGTEEEFWAAFSDADGNRLTYSDICKNLQDARARDDERIAAQARNEYGEDFDQVFTYKKNSQVYVKRKAADIAKQYRALKGDVDDDN